MRFARVARHDRIRLFDLTSMIDVVFLLIIFFMVTARFARDTRADIDLPREPGEQQVEPEQAGMIFNLLADGRIIFDQEEISIERLEEIVLAAIARTPGGDPEQLRLMIRADERGMTDQLNRVIERLRKLGVGAARLATEVPE